MGKALGGARIASTVAGATLGAVVLALALGGCVSAQPRVTPKPQASATPLFATDAEALKAAEEAYASYQKELDLSFSNYNVNTLHRSAVDPALNNAKISVDGYRSTGKHQLGFSTIDSVSAIDTSALTEPSLPGKPIQIYACLDVSKTDVVDSTGTSVVPSDSAKRFPLVVTLSWNKVENSLRVSNEETWDGNDFCS